MINLKQRKNYKKQIKLKRKISIKPKRINEFMKIFIRLFIVVAVILSISTFALLKYLKENNYYSITNRFLLGISNQINDEKFNEIPITDLSSYANNVLVRIYFENSYYYNLVDFCNKLIKRDAEDVGYVVIFDKNDDLVDCQNRYGTFVNDNEEEGNQNQVYVGQYLIYTGEKYSLDDRLAQTLKKSKECDIKVLEGYIKDGYVYPIKLSVDQEEMIFEYSKDCNFDGCRKVEYSDNNRMNILMYGRPGPDVRTREERSYKLYKKNLEIVKNNSRDYNKTKETFYKKDIVISDEKMLNDEKYRFVWFYSINVWDDLYPAFVIVYIISAIIVIILSLIISSSIYNKLNISYLLEKYRVQTTNAMAHDLKSPLMAISSCAENILNNKQGKADDKYAKEILDSVKNMDNMISNILNLSKLESEIGNLKLEEVDVEDTIKTILKRYEKSIDDKNLIVDLKGELKLKSDTGKMLQMFDNIISNISKYAKAGSLVEIVMDSKQITFVNEYDFDIDISAEELLEPFTKGDSARTDTSGNGYGLSIVKTIADAHGFIIDISADNHVFTFCLNL